MDLRKIRKGYGEIIRSYNELFPLHLPTINKFDDGTKNFDKGSEDLSKEMRMQMSKVAAKLKEGADHSGNIQVWHRGEPLDSLNPGMKERIEKALKFGI